MSEKHESREEDRNTDVYLVERALAGLAQPGPNFVGLGCFVLGLGGFLMTGGVVSPYVAIPAGLAVLSVLWGLWLATKITGHVRVSRVEKLRGALTLGAAGATVCLVLVTPRPHEVSEGGIPPLDTTVVVIDTPATTPPESVEVTLDSIEPSAPAPTPTRREPTRPAPQVQISYSSVDVYRIPLDGSDHIILIFEDFALENAGAEDVVAEFEIDALVADDDPARGINCSLLTGPYAPVWRELYPRDDYIASPAVLSANGQESGSLCMTAGTVEGQIDMERFESVHLLMTRNGETEDAFVVSPAGGLHIAPATPGG